MKLTLENLAKIEKAYEAYVEMCRILEIDHTDTDKAVEDTQTFFNEYLILQDEYLRKDIEIAKARLAA